MLLYDKNGIVIGELYETKPVGIESEQSVKSSGTKVALVIGHQENEQGAYGDMGIGEWQFNTELVNDIMATPSNGQICKVFQRDLTISGYTNQMIDLHKKIDQWGARISIEFHFNSFSSPSVEGHEVLYCSSSNVGKVEATALNGCLDKHLPNSNRGAKAVTIHDNGGGFCCNGASYALIIEPFFGVNQHDFIVGGVLRKPLIDAVNDFIAGL